ncbi:hypothetical protein NL676_034074 [Syzygium grande]|nr:hypothetical protein NL676_034074 [Syzygium grande]
MFAAESRDHLFIIERLLREDRMDSDSDAPAYWDVELACGGSKPGGNIEPSNGGSVNRRIAVKASVATTKTKAASLIVVTWNRLNKSNRPIQFGDHYQHARRWVVGVHPGPGQTNSKAPVSLATGIKSRDKRHGRPTSNSGGPCMADACPPPMDHGTATASSVPPIGKTERGRGGGGWSEKQAAVPRQRNVHRSETTTPPRTHRHEWKKRVVVVVVVVVVVGFRRRLKAGSSFISGG